MPGNILDRLQRMFRQFHVHGMLPPDFFGIPKKNLPTRMKIPAHTETKATRSIVANVVAARSPAAAASRRAGAVSRAAIRAGQYD